MTTYAERAKIEQDSRADPAALPTGSTEAEVNAARALLARIRSAAIDVAESLLPEVGAIPAAGSGREAIAWAREVVASPDATAIMMLRLLLAKFDDVTPAQLVFVTDKTILAAIEALVPALAVGRDVRR